MGLPRHPHVPKETLLQCRYPGQSIPQIVGLAADAAAIDHQGPQVAVEAVHRSLPFGAEQGLDAAAGAVQGLLAGRMVGVHRF